MKPDRIGDDDGLNVLQILNSIRPQMTKIVSLNNIEEPPKNVNIEIDQYIS